MEMSRRHNRYDCLLKMAREGHPTKSVIVVRAQGKTIMEAEEECYRKALERCPRFPRPPYLKRGIQIGTRGIAFPRGLLQRASKCDADRFLPTFEARIASLSLQVVAFVSPQPIFVPAA